MKTGAMLAEMERRAQIRILEAEHRENAPLPAQDTFHRLGVFTPSNLERAVKRETKHQYLVDGLLRKGSVNILVGNSGLGKTPLAIQVGLSIASGMSLFGRPVEQGRVLYCDSESDMSQFLETLSVISRFLGCEHVPEEFLTWSPFWENGSRNENHVMPGTRLLDRVEKIEPSLVVIDPLRTFWSEAEAKNRDAAQTFAAMRNNRGTTWLVLHHLRKTNQQIGAPSLADDPHGWFQETAGSFALVNQSDTRLGVVPSPTQGDLLMGGFIRGIGPLPTMDLARVSGDDGSPVGYRLLTGVGHLKPVDRSVFERLPDRFRFKQVLEAMGGNSDSNVNRFLKKSQSIQIIKKDGAEYVKTVQ